MKVIEFLNNLLDVDFGVIEALDYLNKCYGIKYSNNQKYPELFCLNYDQIESPKFNDITVECRSLVISFEDGVFDVVSRSFNRFFNIGESKDNFSSGMVAHEKLDGSLISVWKYKGQWMYRTKSMIMPDEDKIVGAANVSWKHLIESLIKPCDHFMVDFATYIFEIVSDHNRVVTKYEEPAAYLLSIRNSKEEVYSPDFYVDDVAFMGGWKRPKRFDFQSQEDVVNFVESLDKLQEGVVLYHNRVPVLKVKSSAYVMAHRLRGETILTSKRIMDIIFENEQDEYLSVFPEDAEKFEPYIEAYKEVLSSLRCWEEAVSVWEGTQKEFALLVKDLPLASCIFSLKSGYSVIDSFNRLSKNSKYQIIERFL